jgi:ubiquinone/menaquinone biosynthesis C-methylase UbiE
MAAAAVNLKIYNTPEVASHYAALNYLSPCERLIFETYLQPGMAILDLGVGGGRTTPLLSQNASRYVGVDYAEEMIRLCRSRYPLEEFVVADASDLSAFSDMSFDAVVIAFNGLDYIFPEEKRARCLRECWRVLRPGGIFIFSSHNPRAFLVRRSWDHERARTYSRKLAGASNVLYSLVLAAITVVKAILSFFQSAFGTLKRIVKRVPRRAFFYGEGYMMDAVHGGLLTHYWIPSKVIAELQKSEFECARVLGDDYPQKSRSYITDWYYYVFSKQN